MMGNEQHPILFVHNSLPVGGAEQLRLAMCRELQQRHIPFRVCALECPSAIGEELMELGVPVDVLGTKQWVSDVRVWFRLAAYFRKYQPAIVQSSLFEANTHCRLIAPLLSVPALFCEEHGLEMQRIWVQEQWNRLLQGRSDVVLVVSRALYDDMKMHSRISADRLKILLNCIDSYQFDHGSATSLRQSLEIADDTFVIGHVGTLQTDKGHKVLFDAFKRFRQHHRAVLFLVGDGPIRQDLEAYAKQLEISEDVIFAGTRRDLRACYKSMDVFTFPSLAEGLGIALQEAMFMGLPVIASDKGGIPELISHEEDGLLVPAGDSETLSKMLLNLYEHAKLRARLGRNARQKMRQHYLPQQYVDHLFQMYRDVYKQKGFVLPPWLKKTA